MTSEFSRRTELIASIKEEILHYENKAKALDPQKCCDKTKCDTPKQVKPTEDGSADPNKCNALKEEEACITARIDDLRENQDFVSTMMMGDRIKKGWGNISLRDIAVQTSRSNQEDQLKSCSLKKVAANVSSLSILDQIYISLSSNALIFLSIVFSGIAGTLICYAYTNKETTLARVALGLGCPKTASTVQIYCPGSGPRQQTPHCPPIQYFGTLTGFSA
ncbi:MAG: hypothetical protein HQL87_10655 [Magnetococcales bacterium]|nr:hypothetical protein [Magnetococcales bacterium]